MNNRYAPVLFALLMALAMSFCMSFIMTWVNTGLEGNFPFRWMRAFGVGVTVAFPVSVAMTPIANKIVSRLITDE